MYNKDTKKKSVIVRQTIRTKIREENEVASAYEQVGLDKSRPKDWYTKVDEDFNKDINGF